MGKRFKIMARLPSGTVVTVQGQEARTLLLLIEKGATGVVAYDFRGGPPFRLPAYTWSLMRKFGVVIETKHENHDGGWHGRFVLHTPVEIVTTNPAPPSLDAIIKALDMAGPDLDAGNAPQDS